MFSSHLFFSLWSSLMFFFFCFCRGEQVHALCGIEDLMPVIGNSVPSPSLLTLLISQLDSTLQNLRTIHSDAPLNGSDLEIAYDFKTHFISISDDGKIWSWVLTFNRANPQTNDKLLECPTKGNQDFQQNMSFEVYMMELETSLFYFFFFLIFCFFNKTHCCRSH